MYLYEHVTAHAQSLRVQKLCGHIHASNHETAFVSLKVCGTSLRRNIPLSVSLPALRVTEHPPPNCCTLLPSTVGIPRIESILGAESHERKHGTRKVFRDIRPCFSICNLQQRLARVSVESISGLAKARCFLSMHPFCFVCVCMAWCILGESTSRPSVRQCNGEGLGSSKGAPA